MSLSRPCRGVSVLALGLAGATAVTSPLRAAEDTGEGRVHLALRTGYGLPLGRYASVRTIAGFRNSDVNALSDDTYGAIPLWLDVGYRWSAHWMFGAYAMAGLVLPKTAASDDPLGGGCPEGLDCSAFGVRVGLQVQYRFVPGASLDPWLGLGFGYEAIWSDLEGELFNFPVDAGSGHSGPELLHVQGGLDAVLGDGVRVGPFLSLSAARYTACTATLSGAGQDCELDDQSWHGWLALGVRGSLEL